MLSHATAWVQPHSTRFNACRAAWLYAPNSANLKRTLLVALPSRSKLAPNSRSVTDVRTTSALDKADREDSLRGYQVVFEKTMTFSPQLLFLGPGYCSPDSGSKELTD